MDVFEHLVDPVGTVHQLWDALQPGGFLFARFGCESDEDHPTGVPEATRRAARYPHIVMDPERAGQQAREGSNVTYCLKLRPVLRADRRCLVT